MSVLVLDASATSLLLKFNGANGSTTFVEEKGHTVSASGNAALSTAQVKVGTASCYFDGSGDYLDVTTVGSEFNLGSGDFTVAAWVRLSGTTTYKTVINRPNTATTQLGIWVVYNGTTGIHWCQIGSTVTSRAATLSPNTWYHIALVRSAGVIRAFLDGSKIGDDAEDTTEFSGDIRIGRSNTGSDFAGYMDDLVILKGHAQWWDNFTPPADGITIPQTHRVTEAGLVMVSLPPIYRRVTEAGLLVIHRPGAPAPTARPQIFIAT